MKIQGNSYTFTRPFNAFGRASPSLFASQQSFGFGNGASPASGPSAWSAIQRIQTILLERQDRQNGGASSGGGSDVYAENKSITGGAVSGA